MPCCERAVIYGGCLPLRIARSHVHVFQISNLLPMGKDRLTAVRASSDVLEEPAFLQSSFKDVFVDLFRVGVDERSRICPLRHDSELSRVLKHKPSWAPHQVVSSVVLHIAVEMHGSVEQFCPTVYER